MKPPSSLRPLAVLALLGGHARTTSDLLVSNPATHSILRFDGTTGAAKGHFVAQGVGGLTDPRQMVVGPDGKFQIESIR